MAASPCVASILRDAAAPLLRMMRAGKGAHAGLPPARADAAVDGVDHAGRIAGAVGGEECHQVADFAGVRGTTERQALMKFHVAVFVAELVFGGGLERRDAR